MTDRGGAEVARVCPFVALDDDRDRRLSQPDHRHRCFAVSPPAPRAIAHQEAYCLSASFPGCPVFQDWAQREAAAPTSRGTVPVAPVVPVAPGAEQTGSDERDDEDGHEAPARPTPTPEDAIIAAGAGAAAGAAATAPPVPDDFDAVPPGPWDGWTSDPVDEPANPPDIPRRRPGRRDWAAPPPWSGADQAAAASPPPFLADREDERPSPRESTSAAAPPERASSRPRSEPDDLWSERDEPPTPPTPPVVEDEYEPRPPRGRSIAAGRLRNAERGETPPWERPRRSEAYPALKTPMSLPRLGPVALGVIALVVAALVLFFVVPTLLLGGGTPGGGGGGATATPSAPASVAPSVSPTPAAPTPTVYVIKQGDTLSKIAKRFKVSIDDLLAANPSIKNPDRIALGQEIIIPSPDSGDEESVEPSAAESPSG